MVQQMWVALRLILWLTFLTGMAYPLIMTLIGQKLLPEHANGSLLYKDEKIIGSKLIGQEFSSDNYFWSRPSSSDYNGLASGGSNLGPTSAILQKQVAERRKRIVETHALKEGTAIPADLLYASGSGLDPHISLDAMLLQIERVVSARDLSEKQRKKFDQLIVKAIETRQFDLLGSPRVNVLNLNLALDTLTNSHDE